MKRGAAAMLLGAAASVAVVLAIAVSPAAAEATSATKKLEEGIAISGSMDTIVFAVAWAAGEDPTTVATQAARWALDAAGDSVQGIVFFQAYADEAKAKAAGKAVHTAARGLPNIGVYAEPQVNGGHLEKDAVAVLAIGGRKATCRIVRAKLDRDRARLGRSVAGQLRAVRDLKVVIALSEPNLSFEEGITVEGFLHGFMETLGRDIMLWGGNGKPFKELLSRQFYNGNMTSNEVVAMGIGGPFRVVGDHRTEFEPVGEPLTATKVEGKWILELDGKPAATAYRTVSGMKDDEKFTFDDKHPIGVILGDHVYVRQILEYDAKREALRFIAEIPQGTKVRVLKGGTSAERIYDSARVGLRSMLENAKGKTPLLVMVSDCCARGFRLKEFTNGKGDEVLVSWIPALGTRDVPIFSFYAWGEIGYIAGEFKGLVYQYQQHSFVPIMLVAE